VSADEDKEGTAERNAAGPGPGGDPSSPVPRFLVVPDSLRVPALAPSPGGLPPELGRAAIDLMHADAQENAAAVREILARVRAQVNVDAVVILLLGEDQASFESAICARGAASRIRESRLLGAPLASLPALAEALARSNASLQFDNALQAQDKAEGAWLVSANIGSCVLRSLHAGGQRLGLLAFCCDGEAAWPADFAGPMDLLGNAVATGLDRCRARRLLVAERELRELQLQCANDGLWDFDNARKHTYFSPRWKHMLGYGEDELHGDVPDWRTLVHPEDLPRVQARMQAHLDGETEQFCSTHRMRHRNGDWRWVRSRALAVSTGTGRYRRLVAVEVDVTEARQLQEDLQRERESARTILEAIGDGVIRTDGSGCVDYLNPVAEELTGWQLDAARGRPLHELFKTYHEDTCEPLENPIAAAIRRGRTIESLRPTLLIRTSDYQELFVKSTASPVRGPDGRIAGGVLVFHDVSEARELKRRLSFQASHDLLTGLLNRREFQERVERALQGARAGERASALCLIDIDQFKVVNDSCGFEAGDSLLTQVGGLLRSKTRWRDTLSRLGGDEFGVLMEGTTMADAMAAAEVLREEITACRFVWQDRVLRLSASLGVVPIVGGVDAVTDLLATADVACQAAKDAGRNRVHAYDADDMAMLVRRSEMRWATRLNHALDEGRFLLYRQCIQPLGEEHAHDGEHYELLVRLEDGGDAVSPGRFIPAAERFGIAPGIDRWVVRHAFDWFCDNPAELERLWLCSINLSAQSLADERFLPFLIEQFERSRLPGDRFCFEITETAAVASYEQAQKFIARLRRFGCRFALDDFGAGMASFAPLRQLPVDFVKIDGSFVHAIEEDPIDRDMVASINGLCQRMGKRTIAEFAETPAVVSALRELGVNYAQGSAVGEPRPVTERLR
jgi:diguanylate cyclase (GGDEF)-like protein/PAS domain S-box-containing protein